MTTDAGLWTTLSIILSLLITLPFVALAVVLVTRLLRNSARNRELLARGEPAPAVILAAHDTGVTVNDSPQVKLQFEVRPAGRPPFRAETQCAVSDASRPKFVPGATVHVSFGGYGSPLVAVDYAP